MNCSYLSDLHLEVCDQQQAEQRIDKIVKHGNGQVLLLAGDITSFYHSEGIQRFQQLVEQTRSCYQKLVMVMGNHEHYGGNLFETKQRIPGEVVLLDRDIFEYQDKKIAGCTLWTAISRSQYDEARYILNDFNQIKFQTNKFQPSHCNMLFEKDRDWLSEVVDQVDLVMTHHPPLRDAGCSEVEESNRYTNYLFENSLPQLVSRAKIWLCGHTHHVNDFHYHDTRILLNCVGYPGERSNFEIKDLTI